MSAFFSGLVIGFSIAAPVGPIGMLCIKRTLTAGRLCGILTGIGAATADGAYGLIAAAGLSAITAMLLAAGSVMKVLGALFLLYLGYKTIVAKPTESAAHAKIESSPFGAFASSLFLTLTNPMTIISFIAILGTAGTIASDTPGKALMVTGIFTGSCLWWLLLTTLVSALKITPGGKTSRIINIASGCVLIAFGLKCFV
jgi:putative LysE/RhtB family amino acid efflux pump